MTYSFIKTADGSAPRKGLAPELQSIYKRIPESVDHISNESFELPGAEHALFGPESLAIEIPKWEHCREISDDSAQRTKARKSLSKDEESQLFLRFNYARYRLGQLVSKQSKYFSLRRSEEMVKWYQHAQATQAGIAEANMALVMAMARRTRIPHVEFPELVSEGNMALLRAIDKFDVSRGFKFSTYACRAIMKGFNRMASTTGRYIQRFPTIFDPKLERSDYDVMKHEIQRDNALDDLREILADNRAKLSDTEMTVITMRFALATGGDRLILREVGRLIGLTTERVRQIQKRALTKLKAVLDEEYLAV